MVSMRYQVAVLGAGPGGYVAAIRAALEGANVALIEGENVGGVCLNWGCIPTKALVANAEVLSKVRHAGDFGIQTGPVSFDFAFMSRRKDSVVEKIRKSLEGLIAAHKVTIIRGWGQLTSAAQIKVKTGEGYQVIDADKIIIATGSVPRDMPAFPFDFERVHSSNSILGLTQLPKSLVIIGGGVIGAEFAGLYNELGVQVHVVEMMPTLIPTEAKALSQALEAVFKKKGIKITLNARVEGIEKTASGCKLKGVDAEGEMVLVAVGRSLNTQNIGLEKAGVYVDERGVIPVDDRMQTNIPGIYAIGDITAKYMLAHVASHQGIIAAQNAVGIPSKLDYRAVPSVIFTSPEIASVGYSLEKAQAAGYDAVVGKFPFMALGKSQATMETDGFAQIVMDRKTSAIIGAQVMGYGASSLIAPMVLAIQNELTIHCLAETIHAHPTIAESWLEAAQIVMDKPIHMPPARKA